jgi:hypothetical protein
MLFRSLVAASALSLSASAFLVVPETDHHAHDHGNVPATHALELEDARTETVQLACDDCPFPETDSDGVVTWTDATRSSLVSWSYWSGSRDILHLTKFCRT